MYWGFWGFGPGLWGVLGGLLWIVIWALLIWGLFRWFAFGNRRRLSYDPDQPPGGPSALEILRQRYARGEIDAATFEQMRERLKRTDGPGEFIAVLELRHFLPPSKGERGSAAIHGE